MTLQRTPRYYECFAKTSVGEVRINQDYIGGLDGEKAPVTVLIMVCIFTVGIGQVDAQIKE